MSDQNTPKTASQVDSEETRAGTPVTRRQALPIIGLAAVGSACAVAGQAGQRPVARAGKLPGDEALDEAYRLLQNQEPQSNLGLSNHAPMVAEALCMLGQFDCAVPWVREHQGPIVQLPAKTTRIDPANWRAALGPRVGAATWESSNSRWADWKEHFASELSQSRWQDVLNIWVGRLAPGMSGAAAHGVIRTAHAVRGLSRRDTPQRRGELARGLAYWASSYEELPYRHWSGRQTQTFAEALNDVPLYWEAFGRTPDGRNIVEALRHIKELDGFAKVRDLVASPADLSSAISALTATMSRVFLRHGAQHDTIAFVHAVTGPCSLRRMAPHIKADTARAALPFAWQTAAAIYSAYARKNDARMSEESKLSEADLVERAMKNGAAHAIKFTEVMIAEHKLNPDPVYLAAAEVAVKRLQG